MEPRVTTIDPQLKVTSTLSLKATNPPETVMLEHASATSALLSNIISPKMVVNELLVHREAASPEKLESPFKICNITLVNVGVVEPETLKLPKSTVMFELEMVSSERRLPLTDTPPVAMLIMLPSMLNSLSSFAKKVPVVTVIFVLVNVISAELVKRTFPPTVNVISSRVVSTYPRKVNSPKSTSMVEVGAAEKTEFPVTLK